MFPILLSLTLSLPAAPAPSPKAPKGIPPGEYVQIYDFDGTGTTVNWRYTFCANGICCATCGSDSSNTWHGHWRAIHHGVIEIDEQCIAPANAEFSESSYKCKWKARVKSPGVITYAD